MKNFLFYVIRQLNFNYVLEKSKNNRLLILMFHQVNNYNSIFYKGTPINVFKETCLFIKKNYTVLLPSEVKKHFRTSSKPAAIISFDDGHYDIIKNALPILKNLDLPFNVNIDTEILQTGKPQDFVRVYDILNYCNVNSYYDNEFMIKPIDIDKSYAVKVEKEFTKILSNFSVKKRRKFIEKMAIDLKMDEGKYSKMLSINDIKKLNEYKVEFGSHSYSHPILTKLSSEEIYFELKSSKTKLEEIIKSNINILAYPNGIYNEEVENIAKDLGFKFLLKTGDKINKIKNIEEEIVSWRRVNQYHQTINEALAYTFQKTKLLRSIINHFKK